MRKRPSVSSFETQIPMNLADRDPGEDGWPVSAQGIVPPRTRLCKRHRVIVHLCVGNDGR